MSLKINTALELAQLAPVVPVITLDDVAQGMALGDALVAGGLPVMEVTLRSDAALAAIATLAESDLEVLVGAGTVTNRDEMHLAVEAGAAFIITPGGTPELYAAAHELDVILIPGVHTASEVLAARAAGFRFVKFFPAGAAGGPAMLKSFAGPFADMRFCPTGGVSIKNLDDYLSLPNVVCVGGSWITPSRLMREGNFAAITELARDAVAAAHGCLRA